MNWIEEGLAIGGWADAVDEELLRASEISGILCLEQNLPVYPNISGLTVEKFGFPDGGELSQKTLISCLVTIDKWRGEGRNVLVHCGAGVSRSSTVAIAYLSWHYRIPWEVAEAAVKQKHPMAAPNSHLVAQAKEHLAQWQQSQDATFRT